MSLDLEDYCKHLAIGATDSGNLMNSYDEYYASLIDNIGALNTYSELETKFIQRISLVID